MFSLGAIFGGLISAFLGKTYGRRVSLMMLTLPDLLGWVLVASSQNIWMMLTGRFLAGLAAAGYSPNIQIFVAEVSEIFTIQQHVESSQSEEDISFFTAVIKVFTEKKYFKPFFILNFLFFLMIFSGKFTIDFYAVDFFQKTGSSINEYISAVILAFIHLVGSLLFIALVKKLSRKLLLSISSLMMGISLAITGAWMYFSTSQTADWFPIISMLIYMLAAPLGLCSIPFLYIAEFFPSELRSVLAGLTTMLTNIMMAVAIKTFTNLDSLLGHHGLVWLYSAACFGAILLTLSYVPETKDRSLTVINDKFARLRKTVRASPWVTPLPGPSVNSVRKFQYKSQMFTQ